mgnify:CR=1 FL=1
MEETGFSITEGYEDKEKLLGLDTEIDILVDCLLILEELQKDVKPKNDEKVLAYGNAKEGLLDLIGHLIRTELKPEQVH